MLRCGSLEKRDQRVRQVTEGEVVIADPFTANLQTTVEVVPCVGALDDPPTRLPLHASEQRLFTATPDVRNDATPSKFFLNERRVVPFVEAAVFRSPRSTGAAQHNGVDGRQGLFHVVDVRAGDGQRKRYTATIAENVPFRAQFAAIRGILSCVAPPFGAFTEALSIDDHCQSIP